jgi:hypothetical protein
MTSEPPLPTGGASVENSAFGQEFTRWMARHAGNPHMLDAGANAAEGCQKWCAERGLSLAEAPAGLFIRSAKNAATHDGDRNGGATFVPRPKPGPKPGSDGLEGDAMPDSHMVVRDRKGRQRVVEVTPIASPVVTRHRDGSLTGDNGRCLTAQEANDVLGSVSGKQPPPGPTRLVISGDAPVGDADDGLTVFGRIPSTSTSWDELLTLTHSQSAWLSALGLTAHAGDSSEPYAHALITALGLTAIAGQATDPSVPTVINILDGNSEMLRGCWAGTLAPTIIRQRLNSHPIGNQILSAVASAVGHRATRDILNATPFLALSCLRALADPGAEFATVKESIRCQALHPTVPSNTRSVYANRILDDLHVTSTLTGRSKTG